jgi:ABC-type multidrug transport system ATPase subunit
MNEISNAIRIQNLIKFFEDKEILKSVSFAIKKGTIHGFIGPNGAGKTTVIRALVGLVIPNGGEIFINEKLLPYGFSTDKNIGYISSEPKFPEITVKEYMELVEYLTGIELESKFTGSLLYEFKDKLCKELSTG